jgi:SAM-dependent methyltransferase
MTSAALRWALELERWAIPAHILDQAPESPWVHPPALFRVADGAEFVETPSVRAARDGLNQPESTLRSVLDVGCGGGGSSMPIGPWASSLFGVDEQQGMLDNYAVAAERHGVQCSTKLGSWLSVQAETPVADVVICHHVAYNVAEISEFLTALTNHCRSRVVVELPSVHPTAPFSPLWRHFWDLERPTHPTALDLVEVLRESGIEPVVETFRRPPRKAALDGAEYIAFVRRRLCLPATRDGEVAQIISSMDNESTDEVYTVWWTR